MTAVYVALSIFAVMVSVAVIAGVIAAVSTVSGFDKPDDYED